MSIERYLLAGICILALLMTIPVFYSKILTGKWLNKVPNEADCWKWGMVYYNPDDKRIFLPKRTGPGFTFNFARPAAIIFTTMIFAVIIISIILELAR